MLTAEEFSLFRNLIYQESGLYFADSKKEFLEYRIIKRMQATATATPYWYFRFVAEHRQAELPVLLEMMTINETSFYRNLPQFELFRRRVLPEVYARKQNTFPRQVRIWSAGCASGEEPYSIAIDVLEFLERAASWELKIFASDLSLKVLALASRGRYAAEKVRETVPPALLRKYFDFAGEDYRLKEQVRQRISFDFHNLKHENGLADLDIIFCRNVLIYFDDEERKRVIEKFHRSLNPGGYLFLGHAESLQGIDTRFAYVCADRGGAYQKPDGRQL